MHDVACKRGRVGWKTEKEQGINIPKWDWKSIKINLVSFVNSVERGRDVSKCFGAARAQKEMWI